RRHGDAPRRRERAEPLARQRRAPALGRRRRGRAHGRGRNRRGRGHRPRCVERRGALALARLERGLQPAGDRRRRGPRALDRQQGVRLQRRGRTPASLIMRAPSGIVARGDTLFAGFPGGKLVALAISSGAVRWEATISLPKGSTELERVSDVVGEPVLQSREVCAASYQGRVACFEAESGRQTWARDLSSLTGVSLDARYAFASDDHGAVHELDRTSGRSVWKQDQLTLRQLSLPLPVGNAVAVGDFEGQVHFLSRESGAFVSRYATSGGAVRAAPAALPGGGVLIQTQNGGLFALAL